MSSTNRGGVREVSDYYRTDENFIKTFLDEFYKIVPQQAFGILRILEPCAGGDQNNPSMPFVDVLTERGAEDITSLDVREDSSADIKMDYFDYEPEHPFDIIITNPPFVLAMPFIEKSLSLVVEGGWVMMLLRLNFFGSRSRKPFWDKYMPQYVFVNHKRMSFTLDGKSDSIEHAMFCWQKGSYPQFSRIKVI